MITKRKQFKKSKGKGLGILIENNLSPTFHDQLSNILVKYPNAKIYQYELLNSDNQIQALVDLTNQNAYPRYNFDKADIILSFADDFLSFGPFQLDYAKQFSNRRDPDNTESSLNRLYMIENQFTATGAKADHRFPTKQSQIESIISTVLVRISKKVGFQLSEVASVKDNFKGNEFLDNQSVDIIINDLLKNRSSH